MTSTERPIPDPAERHDSLAALRHGGFRRLLAGNFLVIFGEQMLSVALGWELYERTDSAFMLGLIGLVQLVPVLLLALPAGHVVDRYDRKRIAVLTMLALAAAMGGLTWFSATEAPVALAYLFLLLIGIARAFQSPALSSLTPQLVPTTAFANATMWQSSIWQGSAILGPVLAGVLIARQGRATAIYALAMGFVLVAALLFTTLRPRPVRLVTEPPSLGSVLAGLRFIYQQKVLLAALTLDMFAVLVGGVTALLPVFARDILHVGPEGLGWLRTAPALGALLAALIQTQRPPQRRAGWTLLLVVAGFGIATVIFGFSRSFPLSLLMLFLTGALDNVSVVIRSTLVMTRTPDELRGRVNAAHFVFVGISNELGAFESGLVAFWLGAVGAVVAGGIGTVLVVGAIALIWPEVRRLGRLDEVIALSEG